MQVVRVRHLVGSTRLLRFNTYLAALILSVEVAVLDHFEAKVVRRRQMTVDHLGQVHGRLERLRVRERARVEHHLHRLLLHVVA